MKLTKALALLASYRDVCEAQIDGLRFRLARCTRQRDAWVKVSLEQAQTIATLRKLIIARGPSPYTGVMLENVVQLHRKVGCPPELAAPYEGFARSWIYGPDTIKPVTGDMS